MAILTCENHPHLFWRCKDLAVSDNGRYNGSRRIFFAGRAYRADETLPYEGATYTEWAYPRDEGIMLHECACPGSALICIGGSEDAD